MMNEQSGIERPWGNLWFDAKKCVSPSAGIHFIYIPQEAQTASGLVKPGIYQARRAGRAGYLTREGAVAFEDVAYWQPTITLGCLEPVQGMVRVDDSAWGEVIE